jgi:ATP-dependent DNA helicase RecG
MDFMLNTGTNIHKIVIFNRAYLKSKISIGSKVTIIGKYDKKNNTIVASDIRLSLLPREPIIECVYHTSTGITSREINKIINSNIDKIKVEEIIPEYLIDRYKLINRKDSISEIHNPSNRNNLKKALNYLKYEELFLFMLKMNYLQSIREVSKGLERHVDRTNVDNFIHTLPFELTKDQLSSVDDIYNDLCSIKRMNRLLQGDVGSGKTIVSVIALYINYLSGYQGALMAPTEILAIQHYNNLTKLYKDTNIKVELLTGKMKTSEKKKIYKKLLSNEIDILIGTHALFSDNVIYNNLGLVITDEQHRFGVNQRSSLKNKGITPDILYMSATPIPRTYALTIYGDMDISSIHTRPSGRKEVITLLKDSKHIKDVLDLIYQELKNKHQIYVIAPLIEESENSDMENVYELKDKFDRAFSKICKTGILHGKMTSDEKDEIMEQYKNNEISILISTTVIEVGVDVKNATAIVIFDSFRFGLSQLHQLRGRVGRNELQSYCILISDKEAERLNVLTETTDGFKVSEEDFKLRGSGDLFGTRQSGDMKFKVADIKQDFSILLRAKEDSKEVLSSKDYVNNKKYFKLKEALEKSINNA